MKTLLLSLFICSGLAAQAPIAAAEPVVVNGEVYAVLYYTDGSMALASTSGATTTVTTKDGVFTSSFVDKNNVTHTITTPKPRSEGGRKAAMERHVAAVKLMVSAFP